MKKGIRNALTVDVEDAVNQAMRNFFNMDMEPTFRVYDNTIRILDLFEEYNTKATFFILGEVAKAFPELIKEIGERGHELGIHGFSHQRYHALSRNQVKQEIQTAKKLVEDLSGMEVIGHRAPEFSINKETFWVLEILLDEGIKYDSSIFPVAGSRYGWPGFNKDIGRIKVNDEMEIVEVPLSVANYLGKDIAVCGGGYLRVFPYLLTRHAFKKVNNERPVIVYLHPYEIDPPPFQPFYMDAVREASFKYRLQLRKYWFNRKSVIPKLRRMLGEYEFSTMKNVINETIDPKI